MSAATIASCQSPSVVPILGVNVSVLNLATAVGRIGQWVEGKDKAYVCVTNTHLVMECQRDPTLKAIHNRAGMVTPDGMPLVWVGRMKGRPIERVYGPDLLLATCREFLPKGYRHYFYGGAPGVADLLCKRLKEHFSDLEIAGTYSPPFRALSPEEDEQEVQRINAAEPDIVWVGLGAPKQERWMAQHRPRINAPVLLGVGAAFDFHAGVKKQAPRWLQRSGMEWAFRLACEPRRLFKRYAVNNPMFLWCLLRESLGLGDYSEMPKGAVQ